MAFQDSIGMTWTTVEKWSLLNLFNDNEMGGS